MGHLTHASLFLVAGPGERSNDSQIDCAATVTLCGEACDISSRMGAATWNCRITLLFGLIYHRLKRDDWSKPA